jgi:hypothetical protein
MVDELTPEPERRALEMLLARLHAGPPIAESAEAIPLLRENGLSRDRARALIDAAVAGGQLRREGRGVRGGGFSISLGEGETSPPAAPPAPEPEPLAARALRSHLDRRPITGQLCSGCAEPIGHDPTASALGLCFRCFHL